MPRATIKSVVRMTSLLALIGVSPALAMNGIGEYVPNAQKVGEARMSVMLWDVYDATLFAPDGHFSRDKPFALKLTYLRNLYGDKIADHSVQEIRDQGYDDEIKLATWHTQMRQIFPNVSEGDSLVGVFTKNGQTVFYSMDKEIGRIDDPEFGRHFFDIWLSPETRAPNFRLRLLGNNDQKGKENYEVSEGSVYYGGDGVH